MIKERLKQLRHEKGLNQRELAKDLKLSTSTIGMYEAGQRTPDAETLKRTADYFNTTVDYLLGRSNNRDPEKEIIAASREFGYEKDLPPEVYQQIKDYAEYVIAKHEEKKRKGK